MAAQIFAHSENIKKPNLEILSTTSSYQLYQNDIKRYIEDVKNEMFKIYKPTYNQKYFGEVIRIPHADGYAEYMVVSLRPLHLVHLQIADEWDSPYADLLTAKRVVEMIEANKRIEKLFSEKKVNV
jgi:hypothetical protein